MSKLPGICLRFALLCTTVPVNAPAAIAQSEVPPPTVRQPPAVADTPAYSTISYGSNPLQNLDFYPATSSATGKRPLIIFVHGGAWVSGDKSDSTGSAKIRHYTESGYNFATVNYRLLPEVNIADQAQDIADAVAQLRNSADTLNVDDDRIILMGHSAGGHLAALISTDPKYLKAADLKPRDIAGTVLIDAAALDVPRQIRAAGPLLGFAYELAFSANAAQQNLLSPAAHTNSDNVGAWLMLHVERDSAAQARLLADALNKAGSRTDVAAFPGRGMRGHNEINNRLGRSDYPATQSVDEWLQSVLGG